MPRAITSLDHIGLVSRNLKEAEAAYRRLGFAVTQPMPLMGKGPDGKPKYLGQDSQHFVMRDGYVELTAITDAAAHNHLEPFITRYAGLHIVALTTGNADAAAQDLAARGIAPGPVMEAAREVTYGQPGTATFRWFMVPGTTAPEGLFCVVEHGTRGVVFQEAVMSHPNGALALAEVMACVPDVTATAARYERLFDTAPVPVSGGCTFACGSARVTVLDRAGWSARYPGVLPPLLPWLGGYAVQVADLSKTEALLRGAGVETTRSGANALWVHPDAAAGAVLEFRAR